METHAIDISQLDQESLQQLIDELQQSKADLEARQFVERGIARLAELMRWREDDSLSLWSDRLLDELTGLTGGLHAALYISGEAEDRSPALRLVGVNAYNPEDLNREVAYGEGVIGQAAKSKQPRYFSEGAVIEQRSVSGAATVRLSALYVQPLVYNGNVEGVLEISAPEPFSDQAVELLRAVNESIAANLMSIRSREETRELYREAQQKSEALQAQEEEMRQNVEELQATQEEMRRQQAEVAEREARLNAFINNTQDSIVAVDKNYRIIIANDVFRTRAEARGQKIELEFTQLPDALGPGANWEEMVKPYVDKAFEGETFREERESNPDGKTYYYEINFAPVRSISGEVVAVSSVVRDITERKIAEQEAQDQAAMLTAIMDSTDDWVLAINSRYRVANYNEAAVKLFEPLTGREVARGMDVFALVEPENHAKTKETYDRALNGERFVEETVFDLKTGEQLHEVTYNPIRGSEGGIIGVSIFGKNVTERKQREEEFRQTAANLKSVINHTEDHILAIDREYKITMFNESFLKLSRYEYGLDVKKGVDYFSIMPQKTHDMARRNFEYVLREGKPLTWEIEHQSPRGDLQFFETYYNPIYDKDHSLQGISIQMRDVTRLKAVEQEYEELRRAHEQLQKKSGVKTE